MERFGVPVVEDVEDVALESVRRVPLWPGGGGYWVGYCDELMVPGGVYTAVEGAVDEDAVVVGKMPDDVVRVREWPAAWASDSGLI